MDKVADNSQRTRLALLEQKIDIGFKNVNEKLDELVTRTELDIEKTKIYGELDGLSQRVTKMENSYRQPIVNTAIISVVTTAIVTFLLTYFLNSLIGGTR